VVHEDRLAATFGVMDLDPGRATPDAPGKAVLGVLRELGVAACDLTPDLRAAAKSGTATYFRYDGHWTSDGHAVVAKSLEACAAREGW
jgi:hypothetical protein